MTNYIKKRNFIRNIKFMLKVYILFDF